MKKFKLFALLGAAISLVASFTFSTTLSAPTFKEEIVSIESKYGNKDVTLKGSYYDVEGAEYAVLIAPGYSCDRQKWRPMADLFVTNGYSTMTFDYSGQGASYGTIGFDNAKTDRIPEEIDDAIEVLHNKSKIDYEHIILVGHSMGGRSILRLLYDYNNPNAETKCEKKPIKNVILLSPEVNYHYNAQASLFAGTSDANTEPWKSYSKDDIKGTNVYIYGSTSDDIVKSADVFAIAKHLGISNLPEDGVFNGSFTNENGDKVTIGVTSGVLHSYMMWDVQFANYMNQALTSISEKSTSFNPGIMSFVYLSWGFGLFGIFFLLTAIGSKDKELVINELERNDNIPLIKDSKKFLLRKLLFWIPGIILAMVVLVICAVMPFGSPIMNIPYMCFIAGYGFSMLIHYSKGRFKGTEGKLPKPSFKMMFKDKKKNIPLMVITSLFAIFFVWYILWNSMYRLIPANFRLFWLVFATLLMAPCYYISSVEGDMLKKVNASKKVKFFYQLIQYVPLFLFVLFYLVIGSFSGFIGQMQNMILMYMFCLPLGKVIEKYSHNRLYSSLIVAFTFQALMITSAALISFF